MAKRSVILLRRTQHMPGCSISAISCRCLRRPETRVGARCDGEITARPTEPPSVHSGPGSGRAPHPLGRILSSLSARHRTVRAGRALRQPVASDVSQPGATPEARAPRRGDLIDSSASPTEIVVAGEDHHATRTRRPLPSRDAQGRTDALACHAYQREPKIGAVNAVSHDISLIPLATPCWFE
jgi:hypothetical protein